MSNKDLIERLRETIQNVRRKPYPISDLIPMLVEAADALERAGKEPPMYEHLDGHLLDKK